MLTITIRRPHRDPFGALWSLPARAARVAFAWLIDWQARASERAHLNELSDHLLKDVGLTREQLLYGVNTRQCTTC